MVYIVNYTKDLSKTSFPTFVESPMEKIAKFSYFPEEIEYLLVIVC